ncbi:hypothetical protein [Sulfurovum sp.]|uniref:hypothetical protein n=1 Tax=Sulfurovum sp. TaxID=1969726 RepID=UPI003565A831
MSCREIQMLMIVELQTMLDTAQTQGGERGFEMLETLLNRCNALAEAHDQGDPYREIVEYIGADAYFSMEAIATKLGEVTA